MCPTVSGTVNCFYTVPYMRLHGVFFILVQAKEEFGKGISPLAKSRISLNHFFWPPFHEGWENPNLDLTLNGKQSTKSPLSVHFIYEVKRKTLSAKYRENANFGQC